MNNNEEKLGMILGEPFEAFVNAAPISVMMRAVMENTFNPQRLDEIFDQTAESQYTRLLSFSTVTELMSKHKNTMEIIQIEKTEKRIQTTGQIRGSDDLI